MNIFNMLNVVKYRQQKTAWHSLKKNPSFYISIVATVSITVGILLCALTLNDMLLRKPLPYTHQDRLVLAYSAIYDQFGAANSQQYSYPQLVELFEKQKEFELAAIISYETHEVSSLPDQPSIMVAFTTGGFADLFGMKMVVGSFLDVTANTKSRIPSAVISYEMWRDHFNLSRDILEKNITIRSVAHRIIGVVDKDFISPQFTSVGVKTQIWLPWDFNTTEENQRLSWSLMDAKYYLVGRLPINKSINQLEQYLTSLITNKWAEGVAGNEFYRNWNVKIEVKSLQDALLGDSRSLGLMLLAGAIGLLLIACVNVSNLFLLRSAEKQREFAVRASVGARKHHLFDLFFAEAIQLMAVSIAISLLVAFLGFEVMKNNFESILPRVDELSINIFTLVSATLLTLILAFLFAMISASVIDYKKLNRYLSGGGKGIGVQVSAKVRTFLIIIQLALAAVLIVINISLLQRSVHILMEDKGYDVSKSSSLLMMTSESSWPSQKDTFTAMEEFKRKILLLPEVDSFSRSSGSLVPPLTWGVTIPSINERFTPFTIEVDDEYFGLVKQKLLHGRNFSSADLNDWNNLNFSDDEEAWINGSSVIVVDESFANKVTNGAAENALGMRVVYSEGWVPDFPFIIIGVVNDIKHLSADEDKPTIYMPRFAGQTRSIIKYKEGQYLSREKIATLMGAVDKRYVVSLYDSNDDLQTNLLFTQITTAIVTSTLSVFVFFMAALGLYGVLSYSTHLRKIELGTRMAVGAKKKHLVWLVIKDNMNTFFLGLTLGCAILVSVYIGFHTYFFLQVDSKLISISLLAFMLLLGIMCIGCYLPLRAYILKPISSIIRLGE